MGTLETVIAPIWLDLLDEAAQACTAYGRPELARWLQHRRGQLLDPTLRVVLIGEPKQGKSQLLNALINAPVCPVGDGATIAAPVLVHHAPAPTAVLLHDHDPDSTGRGQRGPDDAAQPSRTDVPVAELASRMAAASGGESRPVRAEVGMPRGLLSSGLMLVDTPGAEPDDAPPPHRAPPAAEADVVVLVTDATRELSDTELALLQQAARDHPAVVVALTKVDLVPGWRQIADRNRQHVANAGLSAALLPVSAALRLQAAQASDKTLNAESGFPELIAALLRYLRAKSDVLTPLAAGRLVAGAVEQVVQPLRAELSATGSSEPLARLQRAQRDLDELRRRSTRWQNTLSDEITDVLTDIEYDLRDRTRQVLKEAEDAFDTADPRRGWEAYQSWMDRSLTEAAEASFAWLVDRCDHAANQVAAHFAGYGVVDPPPWQEELSEALAERIPTIEQPHFERFSIVQKIFTGLRGSYLGVLLFGLATTFVAGMSLLNPISVGAGVLFAAKSIQDESKSYLKRRQTAAKATSQRHIDAVFLRVNKEYKNGARRVQRALRDYYTARAEQIHDDIVQSLRSAKEAADADAVERDQRQREIQQRMKRLSALHERARTLTAVRPPAAVAAPPAPRSDVDHAPAAIRHGAGQAAPVAGTVGS